MMAQLMGPQRADRPLYDRVSESTAAVVIRHYSNSFGMASRLLTEPVRTQVRNIYALVRIADEIVDNPDPSISAAARDRMLTWLYDDVQHAMEVGYSANAIVHAFAHTAREVGITNGIVVPFFESMRMDLHRTEHSRESFDRYVYGSAEVVGLMCLRAFLTAPDGPADPDATYAAFTPGARSLGSAFQKINFLRDLGDDHDLLHRRYFPDLDPERFTDAERDRILDDIDDDLAAAGAIMMQLPRSSRRAVIAAHSIFAELAARLRQTPARQIRTSRVRVPNSTKLRIAAGAIRAARA